MAIGIRSNMVVYNDEFYGQFVEELTQQTELFNGASGGSLRLVNGMSKGDYKKEAFFESLSAGGIARRDLTSVAADTPSALTSDDFIWPKVSRYWHRANSIDSLERVGSSVGAFVSAVARQTAKGLMVDYVDTLLAAMQTCVAKSTNYYHDATDGTVQVGDITSGLEKMGDRVDRIDTIVMHSHVFFDLLGDEIANYKFDRVAGFAIASGNALGLGRRILITDSSSLIVTDGVTSGTDAYWTLLLPEGAGTVQVTNVRNFIETVGGLAQLSIRVQGEVDFLTGVKGFAYTGSNVNPTLAQIKTGGDWTLEVDSIKDSFVAIESQ